MHWYGGDRGDCNDTTFILIGQLYDILARRLRSVGGTSEDEKCIW